MRVALKFAIETANRFAAHDGWAIASHIALSSLTSLFPFLIVVTALAGFFGSDELAHETAKLMFLAWPKEVADPIASEVTRVLTQRNHGLLTLGTFASFYFASSGVESLRIGLNRAYQVTEERSWILLRLESIACVIVGAVALVALGFLLVVVPLLFATAFESAPWRTRFEPEFTLARYVLAVFLLAAALVLVHKWLPAGRRRLAEIMPGVVATLVLWLVCGDTFGRYLAHFAHTFVTYYAGLASGMIALSFLYIAAMAFVYGGEVNATFKRVRKETKQGSDADH